MLKDEIEALNPEQRKAVLSVDGRVLILAGAGSGKTKVLTVRMAHLIESHSVSPKQILGLTFTNKAATEMRHRVGMLVSSEKAKQITLSTFHSFCMSILREEIHHLGYTSQFSLYGEREMKRLVEMIARDELAHEADLPSMAATIEAIAKAKNAGLKSMDVPANPTWHDTFCVTVYERLQNSMRAYNAVDFDTLLGLTVELFEQFPAICEKYQDRFRYVMIDEYQDTNPVQYRLATLLTKKYGNLCVVGDDDQSIYGWRGAKVKNILEFERSVLIKLEQNYRSTSSILNGANAVIRNNKERFDKSLWSKKGEGDPIEIFFAPNEKDEAEAVVARIAKIKKEMDIPWGHIAILYRSNLLAKEYELALIKQMWEENGSWNRGIPFDVCGGTAVYERSEVKDLLAYLRVILNPKDQEAILRVINLPRRSIGEVTLDKLTRYNREKKIPLWDVLKDAAHQKNDHNDYQWIQPKALSGIQAFVGVVEKYKQIFQEHPVKASFKQFIEEIAFKKAIEEDVKSDQMRDFKWQNVMELVDAVPDENDQLTSFVSSLTLEPFASGKNKAENRVQLMTIHSSKGLEFPVCFLVGMEDHIIPHEKSLKETGIEEERRLMYVAMTRAKKKLTISMACARKRLGRDAESSPSRFIFEIPKEFLKPTAWDHL